MSYRERAIAQIEKGRSGDNKGIPLKFEKLRNYIPDIQRNTSYLILAESKIGKTSFADDMFLYNIWDYKIANPNVEIDIDYYSFEITAEMKIIKGVARKLWLDYGLLVDVNTILSKGKSYCNDEIYELVIKALDYYENIESVVTIHDSVDNPTGIYKYLLSKAEKYGKIHKKNIQQDPNGPEILRFDHYEPYNKDRYWFIIIDHIALVGSESGKNTKDLIDDLSNYLVRLRNNFGTTDIIIQQLNFDIGNDERIRAGRLTPTLRDVGDSRYTVRNSECIIALFSPFRYNLREFHGYNINRLEDSFRNCEILIQRNGEAGINIGLNFIGAAGTFRELPTAKEMTDAHYNAASNYINTNVKYKKNDKGIYV